MGEREEPQCLGKPVLAAFEVLATKEPPRLSVKHERQVVFALNFLSYKFLNDLRHFFLLFYRVPQQLVRADLM